MSCNTSRRPAILAEEGLHPDWVVAPLVAAGFEVVGCPFTEIPARLATGQFNVVVIGRFYLPYQTLQGELQAIREVTAAVQRLLAAGGGAFIAMPVADQMHYEELLRPLGAQLLPALVTPPEGTRDASGHVAYTTAVADAFAAGVRGLWYPADMVHSPSARPVMMHGEGWQPVVQAAGGSTLAPLPSQGYGLPGEAVTATGDGIPLIAVREASPGRLAVCGIPGGYTVYAPQNYTPGRRLLTEGYAGCPSDLLPLFVTLLHWLAQPSCADSVLGGAQTDPRTLVPQVPRFPDEPPVRWAVGNFPPDCIPKQGLIGARTAYSTGKGTVAEYVAAAQAAGHDFIVFLEEFPALDAAKLAALKAECEAHTTETFFAVPGYTITDVVGSHYFQYGYAIDLPGPDLLSADGRCLANRPDGFVFRNGRIESVHMSLLFGELKMRCRRGAYLHHATPKRLIDNRWTDSIALVTWEDGQVLDDVRDQYPLLMDKGLRLHPTVLTFLNAPADVARAVQAGWRNLLIEPYETMPDLVLRRHMAPELAWWGMIDETVIRHPRYRFDCWQYGTPFQIMTNGPEIRAWTVSVSGRDPAWRGTDAEIPPTADRFRIDVLHFRLRIRITSPVGLEEIRLLDGTRLLRRWQAQGQSVFEVELDFNHAQQMHLMVEATDRHGGRAQSSDYLTLRLDWCEFYCADRNNPLQIGYQRDEHGYADGWSGNEYLTYNSGQWGGSSTYIGRWWFTGDATYPAPPDPLRDETSPTDGGIGMPAAGLHVKVELPVLDPPELGLMLETNQELVSPDVAVCGFTCDHGYDPQSPYFFGKADTGFGVFGAYPTRYVQVHRRKTVFRPRPHALTTMLLQYDLAFHREPHLTEMLPIGWLDPNPAHVFHAEDGRRITIPGTAADRLDQPWQPGEAVVSWTDGTRPVILINDGAALHLCRDATREHAVGIALPAAGLPRLGETATIRLLCLGGTRDHTSPDLFDAVASVMGLNGLPAYQVQLEQGAIDSTRLVLALRSRDGGVALTIPRADLPMALPVTLSALHPQWPVVCYDRVQRRWRPLGMLEDTAYLSLDTTQQDWQLFLGHPVIASHPDIILNLAQTSATTWILEAHNPTRNCLDVSLTPSPYWDLLAWAGETVSLPPGTSWQRGLQTRE